MASLLREPKFCLRPAALSVFSTLLALSIFPVILASTASGPTPLLISVTRVGDSGNGSSYNPGISDNGRFIAFASEAANLVDISDTNKGPDVFVRDLLAG